MVEEIEDKVSNIQFRMVPQDLVDGDFSDAVLRCFLVMQGLGPKGSTAKIATIARKMRRKGEEPVRRAQAVLLKAGFIRLRAKATRHEPNHYDVWPYKPSPGVRSIEPLEDLGVRLDRPPAQSHPSDININKREEGDTAIADSTFLKASRAIAIFCRNYKTALGKRYIITGKDHGALKGILANDLDPDYFEAKVRGYLQSQDSFVIGQAHSLSLFCSQFNKWLAADGNGDEPTHLSRLQI